MRFSEAHRLPVPLADAWAALNDLHVLQQALPGCESLLELDHDEFIGEMAVPLGPVTQRFTLFVQRREVAPPHHCILHFETRNAGTGGRGSAEMRLAADGADATTLQVDVEVATDGLFAQLGAPLIELAARKMAAQFFERLAAAARTPKP